MYWRNIVIDAWGKLPSEIFEGNLYELGGFSECFHIENQGELYKTQYCLANLIVDIGGIPKPQLNRHDVNVFNLPDLFDVNTEDSIESRIGMEQ